MSANPPSVLSIPTATQLVVLGQDTPAKETLPSDVCGFGSVDQAEPFHFSITPASSSPGPGPAPDFSPTAKHRDSDAQDTPLSCSGPPGSTSGTALHVPPLQMSASSWSDSSATQYDVSGQEMVLSPSSPFRAGAESTLHVAAPVAWAAGSSRDRRPTTSAAAHVTPKRTRLAGDLACLARCRIAIRLFSAVTNVSTHDDETLRSVHRAERPLFALPWQFDANRCGSVDETWKGLWTRRTDLSRK